MIGFMFDTNIFNRILDGKLQHDQIANARCFATHIQLDELNATPDLIRKQDLVTIFGKVAPVRVPTDSAVLGVSRFDEAKFGAEDGLYEKLKAELDENSVKPSNIQDALIGETSINNGFTLVTEDRALIAAVKRHWGRVLNVREFVALQKS